MTAAKMPVLSLIVPVYNSVRHIEECLDSVLGQLRPEVELIIVDDGSTDASAQIVATRCAAQIAAGGVILLRQENHGPGGARNAAIDVAAGAYIGFLDSDDILDPAYVRTILETIGRTGAGIIEFPFRRFTDVSSIGRMPFADTYGLRGVHQLRDVRLRVFGAARWFPCTRVFRRDLFDQIRFPERVHYEDLMTIPFIYLHDASICFLEKPLLAYRNNPDSITSLHSPRQLRELLMFYRSTLVPGEGEAINMLRIRVARSIVYFATELRAADVDFSKLIQTSCAARLPKAQLSMLLAADRFFYSWPGLYVWMERYRLPLKHQTVKLMRWLRQKRVAATMFSRTLRGRE